MREVLASDHALTAPTSRSLAAYIRSMGCSVLGAIAWSVNDNDNDDDDNNDNDDDDDDDDYNEDNEDNEDNDGESSGAYNGNGNVTDNGETRDDDGEMIDKKRSVFRSLPPSIPCRASKP